VVRLSTGLISEQGGGGGVGLSASTPLDTARVHPCQLPASLPALAHSCRRRIGGITQFFRATGTEVAVGPGGLEAFSECRISGGPAHTGSGVGWCAH